MPAADNIFLALGFLSLSLMALFRLLFFFFYLWPHFVGLVELFSQQQRCHVIFASRFATVSFWLPKLSGLFFLKLLSTSSSRLFFDTQPAGVFELAEDMCFHSALGVKNGTRRFFLCSHTSPFFDEATFIAIWDGVDRDNGCDQDVSCSGEHSMSCRHKNNVPISFLNFFSRHSGLSRDGFLSNLSNLLHAIHMI